MRDPRAMNEEDDHRELAHWPKVSETIIDHRTGPEWRNDE